VVFQAGSSSSSGSKSRPIIRHDCQGTSPIVYRVPERIAELNDDALLQLASDRQSLNDDATYALDAEMRKRYQSAADLVKHQTFVHRSEQREKSQPSADLLLLTLLLLSNLTVPGLNQSARASAGSRTNEGNTTGRLLGRVVGP
jgi:hypothetical protein